MLLRGALQNCMAGAAQARHSPCFHLQPCCSDKCWASVLVWTRGTVPRLWVWCAEPCYEDRNWRRRVGQEPNHNIRSGGWKGRGTPLCGTGEGVDAAPRHWMGCGTLLVLASVEKTDHFSQSPYGVELLHLKDNSFWHTAVGVQPAERVLTSLWVNRAAWRGSAMGNNYLGQNREFLW